MLFGALGVAFLSATGLWHESPAFKRTPKKPAPDGLVGVSVLQWFTVFKFFYVFLRTLTDKSVAKDLHGPAFNVAPEPHTHQENSDFQSVRCLLINLTNL
jgi:hypothetical protein